MTDEERFKEYQQSTPNVISERIAFMAALESERARVRKLCDRLQLALDDLEGSLPCSDETCICCLVIWPKVERVLALVKEVYL